MTCILQKLVYSLVAIACHILNEQLGVESCLVWLAIVLTIWCWGAAFTHHLGWAWVRHHLRLYLRSLIVKVLLIEILFYFIYFFDVIICLQGFETSFNNDGLIFFCLLFSQFWSSTFLPWFFKFRLKLKFLSIEHLSILN